jgi:hypothetical protein
MALYIATIQSKKRGTARGWVTSMENLSIAVVCTNSNGEWTPQYGLKVNPDKTSQRLELPSCFTLDPLAVACLDDALSNHKRK